MSCPWWGVHSYVTCSPHPPIAMTRGQVLWADAGGWNVALRVVQLPAPWLTCLTEKGSKRWHLIWILMDRLEFTRKKKKRKKGMLAKEYYVQMQRWTKEERVGNRERFRESGVQGLRGEGRVVKVNRDFLATWVDTHQKHRGGWMHS